jgi:DNA primase
MKARTQLTYEDILCKVDEETLFRYYTEFKNISKKFCCPIHKEKTPSCKIFLNSPLIYKCFGCGSTGTIIQVITTRYNCTYHEALQIIANDFNIENTFINKNSAGFILQENHVKKINNTLIKVRYTNWNSKLLEYWNQYSISLKTLEKYNIKPIDYYWINYSRFKTNFGFAYSVNNKFKILQPNDEDFKWTSNCTIENIQGFMQLEPSDLLIITSSLKDVACLNERFNLQCIAPSSENSYLPEGKIAWLKNNYKKIIVYFNNDKAGIAASKDYKERYGFDYILNPKEISKDPSDCFKNNEETQLTEFLKINNIII